MTPDLETAAHILLMRMNTRETHNFIIQNMDPNVSFNDIERLRKRLAKKGEALYLRPLNRVIYEPLKAPVDHAAARDGCNRLRRAIWTYHAKHARTPEARANYARAAGL